MGGSDPTAVTAREDPAISPGLPLSLCALALIAGRVREVLRSAGEAPEVQFLLEILAAVDASGIDLQSLLNSALRYPHAGDMPLVDLGRTLGMAPVELLTIALAAAVEEDLMVGRALAHLQAPIGGSRPTLGLVATSFADADVEGLPLQRLVTGAATRSGLLQLLGEGAPLPERPVAVPLPLYLALKGYDGAWAGATIGLGDVPEVPLPPSILEEARRQAFGLGADPRQALVLRTGCPAEGRSVAAAIAGALGCRAVYLETEPSPGLVPWLILRRLVPVFCFELAPGERKLLPHLPFYSGPIVALCGPDGTVEHAGGVPSSWAPGVPSIEERRQLWQGALGSDTLALELAHHHRHGSGRIAHLGRLTRHQSLLNGRASPHADDVIAASRVGAGTGLDALAQPLTEAIPEEALVLPPGLRRDLELLFQRCRARDRLVEGLGASTTTRYSPGVRALFVGPSGTGKTLGAGWLATRLGVPLYRVDLSAITSKYIGETEKNLAQLLARAEQAEVVLLFDEADSLFGKRTDVKEANDRFANSQTNYLLQRIESFDGIALLTSNSRGRFDSAFSRRLDMIIDFPLPGPEERRSLWQSHLGKGHTLTPREINQLAAAADLAGGHVRNAVLTAAVLAQADARLLTYADVLEGVSGEYRKLGRQMPVELTSRR